MRTEMADKKSAQNTYYSNEHHRSKRLSRTQFIHITDPTSNHTIQYYIHRCDDSQMAYNAYIDIFLLYIALDFLI